MDLSSENKNFEFESTIWLYSGAAAWHFLTLPEEVSKEINFFFSDLKRGWGSLPIEATIGKTTWETSIFPDKKTNSYLLPIKKLVRTSEKLEVDDLVKIKIKLKI